MKAGGCKFFMHGADTPMEPLNTTIRFDGDRAEACVPSEFQTMDRIAIADVLGLKPAQVTSTPSTSAAVSADGRPSIHTFSAKRCDRQSMVGTPVKIVWTREDDLRGG
jgi:isoquinoline 1-oxidoreductase beta subunit